MVYNTRLTSYKVINFPSKFFHDMIHNYFVSIRLFLISNHFSHMFFFLLLGIYIGSNRCSVNRKKQSHPPFCQLTCNINISPAIYICNLTRPAIPTIEMLLLYVKNTLLLQYVHIHGSLSFTISEPLLKGHIPNYYASLWLHPNTMNSYKPITHSIYPRAARGFRLVTFCNLISYIVVN